MDFWSTIGVLFRRWYITIPAFALAVGAAWAVYKTVPTQYTSNAVIVLTMPTHGGSLPYNPTQPNPELNPLIVTDRGLTMTASILIAALNAPDTATDLGIPPGGEIEMKVTNGSSNLEAMANGPLVYIEVQSPDPKLSETLVAKISARARVELREREVQIQAPPQTYIVVTDVVSPTQAMPQIGRRSRAAVVSLALGAISALTAAYGFESIAVARRRKRQRLVRPSTPALAERVP
ncbi:hypothetical protein OIE66_37910 [Nonomuraea sp. NBC_01738]|uniref:hypothetical protein n=1 Tax=Nonomuraea sp. NBC_01738 TaxID=2976003 RepID=UPI002E109F8E|nr:hypothetical protein OIE66_37910 [Nonomuraea sp. NBC_01738]